MQRNANNKNKNLLSENDTFAENSADFRESGSSTEVFKVNTITRTKTGSKSKNSQQKTDENESFKAALKNSLNNQGKSNTGSSKPADTSDPSGAKKEADIMVLKNPDSGSAKSAPVQARPAAKPAGSHKRTVKHKKGISSARSGAGLLGLKSLADLRNSIGGRFSAAQPEKEAENKQAAAEAAKPAEKQTAGNARKQAAESTAPSEVQSPGTFASFVNSVRNQKVSNGPAGAAAKSQTGSTGSLRNTNGTAGGAKNTNVMNNGAVKNANGNTGSLRNANGAVSGAKSAAAPGNIRKTNGTTGANGGANFNSRFTRKPLMIVLIIIGILVVVYFLGVIIIGKSFLPNTYLNGRNVSLKNAQAAEQMFSSEGKVFTVNTIDNYEEISLDDIDYKVDFASSFEDLVDRQTSFAWPVALFSKTEMNDAVETTINESALKTIVENMDAFNENLIVHPVDAHLEKNASGVYEIVPEIEGNELIPDKTYSMIRNAILNGQSQIDLQEAGCYVKPEVYSNAPSLDKELKIIQKLHNETIFMDMTGATEELTADKIAEMVTMNASGVIEADYENIYAYVEELAEKYNTYMSTRLFTTSYGDVVEVGGYSVDGVSNDTYGFFMDQDETAYTIAEAIVSGESQTIFPTWTVPAVTRDDVNGDIGTTYVELCLAAQHLWYYIDGELAIDCDVVTGLSTDARRVTPTGCFRIWQKDKDATLTGELDGVKWETKVGYYMATTWTGVGLHDATWRYSFGGDIYTYDGSHGCVNMPYDAAEFIFENADLDTPVVVY